jgi:hypothetical protein
MDYILNRCDENAIEAVAAAVVRRRRDLALFGGMGNLPNPQRMAQDLSAQMNIGATIEGLKDTIRDMAVRIVRQEAPELTDEQAAELVGNWVPEHKRGTENGARKTGGEGNAGESAGTPSLPPDVLELMIDQFTAFSMGNMSPEEDARLREEMHEWPERYWNAFPPVIRLIIKDYLKGEMTGEDFRAHVRTALSL